MKNFVLTSLMLIINFVCIAQISVSSFVQLNDADARVNSEIDKDGEACALIKIVTSAQDFTFDAGLLEIVKVSYEYTGEVWVYVQKGLQKLKISHQDLGTLRGADVHSDGFYYFPTGSLKSATSYRMELTHKEVIKTVGPQDPGMLVFLCDVEGAEVFLGENERSLGFVTNGKFTISWPKGQYVRYKIHQNRYKDVEGTIKVEKDEENIHINLIPLFGTVHINSIDNAKIMINDELIGKGSIKKDLDIGSYKLSVSALGYRDKEMRFSIGAGETKTISLNPEKIYGLAEFISSPSGAMVYIDGKNYGATPLTVKKLEVGEHQLELRKSQYITISKTFVVVGDQKNIITEQFTTKRNVQRIKDLYNHNQFSFSAGYSFPLSAVFINFGLGLFKTTNIEIEIGGFYGFSKSDKLYIYDTSFNEIGLSTYKPYGLFASTGYILKFGTQSLLSPKVGIRHILLKNDWQSLSNEDPTKGTNALSFIPGIKYSYIFYPHFKYFITAEYAIKMKSSKAMDNIIEKDKTIEKFTNGITLTTGFSIYF